MAVSLVQKNAYATSIATVPTMDPQAADQSTVIFVAASTAAAATSFLATAALAPRGEHDHATHAATPAARRATSASGPSGSVPVPHRTPTFAAKGGRRGVVRRRRRGEAEDDDTRTRRGRTGTE